MCGDIVLFLNSIEKKAKRYDRALAKAKDMLNYKEVRQEDMEYLFPELKESIEPEPFKINDDTISKEWLYDIKMKRVFEFSHMSNFGVYVYDKEGNCHRNTDVRPATIEEIPHSESEQEELNEFEKWFKKLIGCYASAMGTPLIEQPEDRQNDFVKKHAQSLLSIARKQIASEINVDEMVQKFKAGDWVMLDRPVLITKVEDMPYNTHQYWTSDGTWFGDATNAKLWTIQDAKDGDVLYDGNNACLFRKKMEDDDAIWVDTYCGINSDGMFNVNDEDECWCLACDCAPATKEQRDILMKAMVDAGYTFDFKKKELKKIEQKPANWLQELEDKLANATPKQLAEWKEKYFKEEPAEWSEEDEQYLKDTLRLLEGYSPEVYNYYKVRDWLKSIRPRSHWKPSDEQIVALRWVLNHIPYDSHKEEISGLLEQLKKLREE